MASEFEVPLEASVQLLRQVLPRMSRLQIPTIPQNYAVWYDYVSNRTPGLRREVDRLLSAGSQFDPDDCRRIWEEFYQDPARREVDGLRESMRDAVETVMKELGTLGDDITQYSSFLDTATSTLSSDEMSQDDIKRLIVGLAKETAQAHRRSQEVEGSLGTMVEELAEMRAQMHRLNRDSRTDALTAVANRRAFDETIERLMSEATDSEPLGLILADVDRFKVFNDTHGHLVGDRVLRFVAHEMQQCVKGRDFLARYGGEEFGILLPATRLDGALKLAESIRTIIESEEIDNRPGEAGYKVTISIGVAQHRPGESVSTLIDRADACLYRSKERGRNRVTGERDLELIVNERAS